MKEITLDKVYERWNTPMYWKDRPYKIRQMPRSRFNFSEWCDLHKRWGYIII